MKMQNGDMYKGDFLNDHFHGNGVYHCANGDHYVGEFRNGKKEGKGKWTGVDKDIYIGDFKNDLFHGQGRYKYHNGDSYEGGFYAGLRDGDGTFFSPYENSDKTIRGNWKRDVLQLNYNPVPTLKTAP